jgi:hypothetical protein
MKRSLLIKVIKKADAVELKKSRRRPRKKKTEPQGKDLLTTVNEWVTDLRGRQVEDAHAAVSELFGPAPVTNE